MQLSLFKDDVSTLPELRRQLDEVCERIQKIQDECLHTDAVKIPEADTGNWDRNSDRYWYRCTCNLCGKYWTEDQ